MVKRLALLYRHHFKKKLFNKIFVTYSIITTLSLLALAFFISAHLIQTSRQKELIHNQQILEDIGTYFKNKYDASQKMLRPLYNHYHFIPFMTYDYDQFLAYSLKTYMNHNTNAFRNIDNYLHSCFLRDSDIQNIILYNRGNHFFYISSENNARTNYLFAPDAMKFAEKINEISRSHDFFNPYLCTDLNIAASSQPAFTIVTGINNPATLENIGNLIINYNLAGISKSYAKYEKTLKGYILILTQDGNVVFDSSNRYYGKKYPYFHLLHNTSESLMFEEESIVNIHTLGMPDVIIAGIIPESELLEGSKIMQRTIFIIALSCILGAILLTYFNMLIFSRRADSIMGAMKELQQGNFSARIPIDQNEDELTQIAISFNRMCKHLNTYIDKVYLSEIKQKNAELIALQTQINPHFLYNTLEAIRMRAVSKGVHDVGEMIYILATLFRHSVKNEMLISISDEVEHCKLYLALFQIRYRDKLTFKINIEEEILTYSIIKFSLQPIIENYIVHGIQLDMADNIIEIKGYRECDEIYFTITDNGMGIEKERLALLKASLQTPSHSSAAEIGLSNVNERLKIIYGDQYGISIDSTINMGTSVSVKIPAQKRGE